MADKFKFRILTGPDPQLQYAGIAVKDPMTFYLLENGIGYLGETPLFGGGAINTIILMSDTLTNPEQGKLYVLSNVSYGINTLTGLYFYDGTNMLCYSDELIAGYLQNIFIYDMTANGYIGDNNTIASTKAIVDLVNKKFSELEAVKFSDVKTHVITEADLVNPYISMDENVSVGDVGLLFTVTLGTDVLGDEKYCFVSLVDYLTVTYKTKDTPSVHLSITEDNEIQAELTIHEKEESIKIDTEKGVYLDKSEIINEETPSNAKLVTEASLIQYIKDTLIPKVSTIVDEAVENAVEAIIDDTVREVAIAGQIYPNLTTAIESCSVPTTIYLVDNTTSEGIYVQPNQDITIEMNGKTLNLENPGAGSAGTTTNGCQLLQGGNVTLKNGTIKAKDAKIVIQNYSNLILDNIVIEGFETNQYLLSNNCGNIILRNSTTLNALEGSIAFDLYYGMREVYDVGVCVTIEDNSVIVNGPIEYSKATRASQENFETNCKLITPVGYVLNIPEGYKWTDFGNGTQRLTAVATS